MTASSFPGGMMPEVVLKECSYCGKSAVVTTTLCTWCGLRFKDAPTENILPTAAGSSGAEAPSHITPPPPILNGQAAASFSPNGISRKTCPKCAAVLDGFALLCPQCWTAFIGALPDGQPNWAWLCQRLTDRLTYAEERLRLQADGAERAWELVRLHHGEVENLRRERFEWMQVLNAIPGACGDTTVARAWVERVKNMEAKI